MSKIARVACLGWLTVGLPACAHRPRAMGIVRSPDPLVQEVGTHMDAEPSRPPAEGTEPAVGVSVSSGVEPIPEATKREKKKKKKASYGDAPNP